MARNFRPGRKYLPGVVVRRLGPLTFLVEVKDGLTHPIVKPKDLFLLSSKQFKLGRGKASL